MNEKRNKGLVLFEYGKNEQLIKKSSNILKELEEKLA